MLMLQCWEGEARSRAMLAVPNIAGLPCRAAEAGMHDAGELRRRIGCVPSPRLPPVVVGAYQRRVTCDSISDTTEAAFGERGRRL